MKTRTRINIAQSKSWLKKQKQKLKKKLKAATKSEKIEIVKMHLDNIYDSYSNLIGLIPDIEKRIEELGTLEENKELKGLWKKVLNDLKHLKNRPKATKIYYAKRVVSQIKKLRSKYPNE